jgi:taurine dioxygenase
VHTTALHPLGVRLTGADLSTVDVAVVRRLLAAHGVLVAPAQHLDDAAFVAFLRRFGELVFTAGETPVPGFPDLNVVTNVGRTTPPRSVFHVDTSYVPVPPAYTALRAVQIPERGGQTLFTDQYRAHDTLPPELRDTLVGRTITHRVSGVAGDRDSQAEHPALRRHPVSGRTSLYLSTPQRCVAVSGMDAAASASLIDRLYRHSTAEENTLRHTWSPGDVVMWDNGCVLHRADHDGVVGDRTMHRGMVAAAA